MNEQNLMGAYKDLEKHFYSDGYRLAMKALHPGCSKADLMEAVGQMHRMGDEIIDSFNAYARSQDKAPDCKKGCSWCCYQPVFVLSYELETLNDYLMSRFSVEDRVKVYQRADEKLKRLEGLTGERLLHSKHACPFFEKGSCMVHEVRPVACRIYLSMDVVSCKNFFNHPENNDLAPALMHFPMRMGRMIHEGFRAALKTIGVSAEEYRIEEFRHGR